MRLRKTQGNAKKTNTFLAHYFTKIQIYQVCNRGLDICNSQIQSILQNRKIPTLFRTFF